MGYMKKTIESTQEIKTSPFKDKVLRNLIKSARLTKEEETADEAITLPSVPRLRTNKPAGEYKLPDAINRIADKTGFVQIPNSLARNPNISSVAKTILTILLSNKDGWKTYAITLETMMKEGRDVIEKGLKELNQHGYRSIIKFRDKKTKALKGSFWAYTDVANNFSYHQNVLILENKGCEIIPKSKVKSRNPDDQGSGKIVENSKSINMRRKPLILHRNPEKPESGESATKNTNSKKEKNKRSDLLPNPPVHSDAYNYQCKLRGPVIIDDSIHYKLGEDGQYHTFKGNIYIP